MCENVDSHALGWGGATGGLEVRRALPEGPVRYPVRSECQEAARLRVAQEIDNTYKTLFSYPRMVSDLLTGFVREDWVRELDLSTLEKVSASYVADELRERHDDSALAHPQTEEQHQIEHQAIDPGGIARGQPRMQRFPGRHIDRGCAPAHPAGSSNVRHASSAPPGRCDAAAPGPASVL